MTRVNPTRDDLTPPFPHDGPTGAQWRFLLRSAILAPSSHNSQPWRFRVVGDALELRADRTRALPVVDPQDRALTLSCGAALGLLRVALRRFGYAGDIQRLPDAADLDLLARVRLGERVQPTPQDLALFDAILHRRTTRRAYERGRLPPELLDELRGLAEREGAWVQVLENGARLRAVCLVVQGDQHQFADPAFRRELAHWMRPSREHDGLATGDVQAAVTAFVLRTFDVGNGTAARDRELADGSPVLAVLGTPGDTPQDWLAGGQALAFVLLAVTAAGATGA